MNNWDYILRRLDGECISALTALSAAEGFPYRLTEDSAAVYCRDREPEAQGVSTYGVFCGEVLVSVMTATFCAVFPCDDSPSGRSVHISGAYTLPGFRGRGYAIVLRERIQDDSAAFGADYICCDSTADGLYLRFGFKSAPAGETRMWKIIGN